MSNYSHKGYEQRTEGYGRRRRKASGFLKKSAGSKAAGLAVCTVAAVAVGILVYLFADNIFLFVDSLRHNDTESDITETNDIPVSAEISETPDTPDLPPAQGEFDKVDENVFVSNGSGYVRFKGIDRSARNYAAVLNSISSSMSSKVSIYAAVIPTKTDICLDGTLEGSNSQKDNLSVIASSLSDRVNNIDVRSQLYAHRSDYVYFRTDDSLTALGGYYAYCEIESTIDADGSGLYTLDELSKKRGSIARFEGSFIQRTTDPKKQPHGNQQLFDNADVIEYFKVPVHYNCYAVDQKTGGRVETDLFSEKYTADDSLKIFPAKDTPLLYAENVQTEKQHKLLIVKDHAAEPVIGYFVPHFAEVHIADVSLYSGNLRQYVNEHEIDTVLFINGISNANNSLYCQRMRDQFDNSISD